MRRPLIFFAVGAALVLAPVAASAQYGRSSPRPGGGGAQEPSPSEKSKKNDEWNLSKAPTPGVAAAGPCPYVKILYDAARYQEFAGGRESSTTVGYTGEI